MSRLKADDAEGRGREGKQNKGNGAGDATVPGAVTSFEIVDLDEDTPGLPGVTAYPQQIEALIIESNRLAGDLSEAEGDIAKVELLIKDRLGLIVEEVTAEVQAARTPVVVKAKKAGEADETKDVATYGSEDARKLEVQRRLRVHPAYRALFFLDATLAGDSPELPIQPRTLIMRLTQAREAARAVRQSKVRVDARLSRMRRELDLLQIDYERQQLGERRA